MMNEPTKSTQVITPALKPLSVRGQGCFFLSSSRRENTSNGPCQGPSHRNPGNNKMALGFPLSSIVSWFPCSPTSPENGGQILRQLKTRSGAEMNSCVEIKKPCQAGESWQDFKTVSMPVQI